MSEKGKNTCNDDHNDDDDGEQEEKADYGTNRRETFCNFAMNIKF